MATSGALTNIVILGAGKGGTALLESFLNLPSIRLIGVADKDPEAQGLKIAKFHHILTTHNPFDFINRPDIHLIVDVTGDPNLRDMIDQQKNPGTEVLGGAASKVLWDLIQQETTIQAQLFQAEKLAGMGTFASGIAHDINNPLYVILAMAEAIEEEKELSTIHQLATSIKEAAQRIHTISRDITQYARASQTHDTTHVDIQTQLEEALTIARYATTFHEISIHKQFQKGLIIYAKPEEILQILVNLLTNAIQAMQGSGSLTLTSERTNETVRISIADTGCGIPEDIREKIFSPFFTTKPPGKGTGLGLYNVRTLVKKNQGELSLDSVPGKGTTFQLTFPLYSSTENGKA